MTRIVLLVVLAFAVCLASSCAKKQPPQTPTKAPQKTAPATPAKAPEAAKPAVQPAALTTEAPKPAAPAPAPQPPAAAAPSAGKMVELAIELPKPMFVGTPQDIKVENLEKPLGKPRHPMLVPEGTVNLAKDKPVKSSDEMPIIGEISYITDGDKEAADGSYVELGPLVQHITVDLGKTCELYAIVVWHYHKQPRVYTDVVVQVSNDADFIKDVKTVFNNDLDNSAGLGVGTDKHYIETSEGKLIDLISQGSPKARYVRFYSNGNTSNDLNHYIEVEVYGKPAQ
ncbi:MAG: discoidin domain-containing protein [Planctomycetes bacterium]|nr:discoidin domain-containing protein [Planctomycetota bacterium]